MIAKNIYLRLPSYDPDNLTDECFEFIPVLTGRREEIRQDNGGFNWELHDVAFNKCKSDPRFIYSDGYEINLESGELRKHFYSKK